MTKLRLSRSSRTQLEASEIMICSLITSLAKKVNLSKVSDFLNSVRIKEQLDSLTQVRWCRAQDQGIQTWQAVKISATPQTIKTMNLWANKKWPTKAQSTQRRKWTKSAQMFTSDLLILLIKRYSPNPTGNNLSLVKNQSQQRKVAKLLEKVTLALS